MTDKAGTVMAWPTASSAQSYPMPDGREFTGEKDWTRVKNPVERRRIQNRISQRTYRYRMKMARHDSFQSSPEYQETKEQQRDERNEHNGSTSNDKILSPPLRPTVAEKSPTQVPTPTPKLPLYTPPLNESDSQFFQHPVGPIGSPPLAQLFAQPHNVLTPGRLDWNNSKVLDEFMLHRIRLQPQLLNKIYSLPEGPTFAHSNSQLDNIGNGSTSPWLGSLPMGHDAHVTGDTTMRNMSQTEQVDTGATFLQEHHGSMEFNFDPNGSAWKPEDLSQGIRTSPITASARVHENQAITHGSNATPTIPRTKHPTSSSQDSSAVPAKHALLHELFECIMDPVEASGFDSFDALVTAYYCETFRDSSPLANEQRLSRNRMLPKVIADVFSATDQWTAWERRGFHEEILKMAESMLISEGNNPGEADISSLLKAQETQADVSSTEQTIPDLKRLFRDKLPNLWVLTMALAGNNRDSWQRDRSNTALAVVLLLHCAGRVSNQQLLRLVTACLEKT